MISARQQAANIRNAAKSTGPATAEGRSRSAQNAITHGLTGSEALLASEDADAFRKHMAAYQANHCPQNEQEDFFVVQMAEAAWRLRRVRKFESQILDSTPDLTTDEPLNKLAKLSRYEASIERSYYRAYRELQNLHRRRHQAQIAAMDAYILGPINRELPLPDLSAASTAKRTHSQNRTPDAAAETAASLGFHTLHLQDPEVQEMTNRFVKAIAGIKPQQSTGGSR